MAQETTVNTAPASGSTPAPSHTIAVPIPADSLGICYAGEALKPLPYVGFMPTMWNGWSAWPLHPGINVTLGASVFAQFGKNARHGAGFTQDIALMYAAPLAKNLGLVVGAYGGSTQWAHTAYQRVGLAGALSWKIDERWEASLYGQKHIAGNGLPYAAGLWARSPFMPLRPYDPCYDDATADRIGAALRYNVTPALSFTISVESVKPNYGTAPVFVVPSDRLNRSH